MEASQPQKPGKFVENPATPRESGPHRKVNPSVCGKYLPAVLLVLAIALFVLATWLFR